MTAGFYLMHRGWMRNPVFGDREFCQRAAWAWLIEEAAYGDRGGLKRGQLRHSTRFMAAAWGWNEVAVRRFLAKLSDPEVSMICRSSDAAGSVVTICNYEQYQDATESAVYRLSAERSPTDANEKEQTKKKKALSLELPLSDRNPTKPELMVEIWNRVCGSKLAKAKLTSNRLRPIEMRLKDSFDGKLEAWEAFCHRVAAAPFLCGDSERGWKADLDWCLKPASIEKILAGRYDRNGSPGQPPNRPAPPSGPRIPGRIL